MKRTMTYLCAAMVLVLSAAAPAFARVVPEPGTTALLASLIPGALIAYKIIKRK